MNVHEICTTDVVAVAPDDLVAIARVRMHDAGVSALPVVDKGELVGIVTATDLLVDDTPSGLPVRNVMSDEVRTVDVDTSLRDAAQTMRFDGIHHLVVIDGDGATLGMLSSFDVVRALASAED